MTIPEQVAQLQVLGEAFARYHRQHPAAAVEFDALDRVARQALGDAPLVLTERYAAMVGQRSWAALRDHDLALAWACAHAARWIAHERRELLMEATALDTIGLVELASARWRAVVDVLTPSIALRLRLVDPAGRPNPDQSRTLLAFRDVAGSLGMRAQAYAHLGEYPAAIEDSTVAVSMLRRLDEVTGRPETRHRLAMSLNNRGIACLGQGDVARALADCDEAAALLRRLVEDDGHRAHGGDLAQALGNRGLALQANGRLDEAVAAYDAAVERYRTLIGAEPRHPLRAGLATALDGRASVHRQLGNQQAARDDDNAIAIRRDLTGEDQPERPFKLADALMNLGQPAL